MKDDNPMLDTISAAIARKIEANRKSGDLMAEIVKKHNNRIMKDSEMMNPSTHIMLCDIVGVLPEDSELIMPGIFLKPILCTHYSA